MLIGFALGVIFGIVITILFILCLGPKNGQRNYQSMGSIAGTSGRAPYSTRFTPIVIPTTLPWGVECHERPCA
jgi:hypothetical protein